MMVVMALSAVLLAGCGQDDGEDGRDTIADAGGAGVIETQGPEDTAGTEGTADVFYSDPNRIVLFYHDAEILAEYTKIGTFDATEEFVTAVEENPVLEGWGNKIIQISQP